MFSFLLSGLVGSVVGQVAMPMTADYTCWMADTTGRIIDMSYMCPSGGGEVAAISEASILPTEEEAEVAVIPMAGSVCADFATQGEAQYHYLLGTAPPSVDGDQDGIACEELEYIDNRADGGRVSTYRSTRYAGVDIELFDAGRRIIDGDFYLRVTAPGLGVFTTRSFSDRPAANEHMRTYYGYTQGL